MEANPSHHNKIDRVVSQVLMRRCPIFHMREWGQGLSRAFTGEHFDNISLVIETDTNGTVDLLQRPPSTIQGPGAQIARPLLNLCAKADRFLWETLTLRHEHPDD